MDVLLVSLLLLLLFSMMVLLLRNKTLSTELNRLSNIEFRYTEQQILNSELINTTGVGTWEWNIKTGETRFNERWASMLGYRLAELEPISIQTWMDLAHPDDLVTSEQKLNDHFEGKTEYYQCEARIRHRDGHWIWVMDTGKVIDWDAEGKPLQMVGIHQDISELKEVVTEAAINQRKLQTLVSNLPGIAYRCQADRSRTMHYMSPMTSTITGYHPKEIENNRDITFEDLILPQCREKVRSEIEIALNHRVPFEIEYRITTKNGESRWFMEKGQCVEYNDDTPSVIEGLIMDITDIKQANEILAYRELELKKTQHIAKLGSWRIDHDSGQMEWSKELYDIFRINTSVALPRFEEQSQFYTDESWQRVVAFFNELGSQSEAQETELEIVRSDGSLGWIFVHAEIQKDPHDKALYYWGTAQDITDHKHAELDRERFSKRLAQTSKMETVGQLTGGIAHDFNNLLTIILGNLELMDINNMQDQTQREQLQSMNRAAERAAELIQQLLGFSRKHPYKVEDLDINQLITGMQDMIVRSVTPAITVNVELQPQLWKCKVDSGEFKDTLLNLVTNAHDAMGQGGKLSITTHNTELNEEFCRYQTDLKPGSYVELLISDTGAGIEPEILDRIFEPFFTTKDSGKGTGLGLAMVFGFVRRSGGKIIAHSRLGEGTDIHLYFPVSTPPVMKVVESIQTSNPKRLGSENPAILIMESNQHLLQQMASFLEHCDYRVLSSNNILLASELLERNPDIRLLMTQIPLQGDKAVAELIEYAHQCIPDITVLVSVSPAFTSHIPMVKNNSSFTNAPLNQILLSDLLSKVNTLLYPDEYPNRLEPIVWHEKNSSGNPEIDKQRKKLIELHNTIISRDQEKQMMTLDLAQDEFSKQLRNCFVTEDKILTQVDLPKAKDHQLVHKVLLQDYEQRLRTLKHEPKSFNRIAREIRKWWFDHSVEMDHQFRFYQPSSTRTD